MVWHGVDLAWAYADLLGGIHRRTGCVHRAYDVLHDSLVRVALIGMRRPIPQPHAYLRTVVKTVLVDHYREASRWVALPEPDEGEVQSLAADGQPDTAPSAEHLADLNQRLQFTRKILDCLPPRCREVFWYFCIEGYTQPEIAAKVGTTLKTVERHVMRAMIDIRAARRDVMG